jgi:ribosomal protein L16 Arg81 hydroxylase
LGQLFYLRIFYYKMEFRNINKLISPISIDVFSEKYWEKNYLVIKRNDEIYFDDILNRQDINDFLGRKDIYYPFIRIVHKNEALPKSEYVKKIHEPGFNIIDTDKMFSFYNDGGTIVIQKGQLSIRKLLDFCDETEQECNFSVNANIYVTPKNTAGFNAHYDTHDIFILQISGKKHWRLFDSFYNLPLNNQIISKEDSGRYSSIAPEMEVELCPGDLIYIPRGYVHDTFTKDDNSIHITLGVFPFKRVDFFRKIVDRAEKEEKFRKFLPTIFSSEEEKKFFNENFKPLLKSYIDEFSIEDLQLSFDDNFLAERYANNENRFIDTCQIDNINNETIVSVVENLSFRFLDSEDGKISLKFYDKEITFPQFIDTSLKSIASSTKIKVKEIEGSLDNVSKVILVKKLIKEGFLRIAGK